MPLTPLEEAEAKKQTVQPLGWIRGKHRTSHIWPCIISSQIVLLLQRESTQTKLPVSFPWGGTRKEDVYYTQLMYRENVLRRATVHNCSFCFVVNIPCTSVFQLQILRQLVFFVFLSQITHWNREGIKGHVFWPIGLILSQGVC